MTKKLTQAPAAACRLAGGAVEFAASTDEGKTRPIRMMARSAQPIDHWFWGKIVHDMAGMKLSKNVIPVDYEHFEPIGYLDRFQAGPAGLFVDGSLVITDEPGDRARQLTKLSDGGVPFEASINFAGDGIKIEQLYEGQVAQVNGYAFEGPGVIVREWPLRGVAVCPYGADMNTQSEFKRSAEQSFSLTHLNGASDMPKNLSAATAGASVNDESQTDEQKPAGDQTAHTEPAATDATTDEAKPAEGAEELSATRAEIKRFRHAFGAKGLEYFADALSFEQALAKDAAELRNQVAALTSENAALQKKLGSKPADGETSPVKFNASDEKKRDGFASKLRFVGASTK